MNPIIPFPWLCLYRSKHCLPITKHAPCLYSLYLQLWCDIFIKGMEKRSRGSYRWRWSSRNQYCLSLVSIRLEGCVSAGKIRVDSGIHLARCKLSNKNSFLKRKQKLKPPRTNGMRAFWLKTLQAKCSSKNKTFSNKKKKTSFEINNFNFLHQIRHFKSAFGS